jgi:hypothetical protein
MQMNKFVKEKSKHHQHLHKTKTKSRNMGGGGGGGEIGEKNRKLLHQNVVLKKNINIDVKICKGRVGSMPT